MAIETGNLFHELRLRGRVTKVFVSPALRCIQTAKPIAEALNCKLCIEEGLFEFPSGNIMNADRKYFGGKLDFPAQPFPSIEERRMYFTCVDPDYESVIKVPKVSKTSNSITSFTSHIINSIRMKMSPRI